MILVASSSFAWLVVGVPFLCLHRGGVRPFFTPGIGNQDIPQYYMGGAMAGAGRFDALYPVPGTNRAQNAGWREASDLKPAYREMMERRGVEDSHRFNLPPPSALLFIPLAWLPYAAARWVWLMGLGACCWGLCWIGYRQGRRCGCSRATGLAWWMVWAFSPLFMKTLRTGNATPLAALALGAAVVAVVSNRPAGAVAGGVLAVLLKGAGIVLIPLVLLLRRWRIALLGAAVSVAMVAIALGLAGWGVFVEYVREILPTMRTIDRFVGNQSALGVAARVANGVVSDGFLTRAVGWAGAAAAGAALICVWRRRVLLRSDRTAFLAAATILAGIALVFSPFCWEHYVLHTIPFWWALWTAARRAGRATLAVGALLIGLPLGVLRGGSFAPWEIARSAVFFGQIAVIAGAWSVLVSRAANGRAGELARRPPIAVDSPP